MFTWVCILMSNRIRENPHLEIKTRVGVKLFMPQKKKNPKYKNDFPDSYHLFWIMLMTLCWVFEPVIIWVEMDLKWPQILYSSSHGRVESSSSLLDSVLVLWGALINRMRRKWRYERDLPTRCQGAISSFLPPLFQALGFTAHCFPAFPVSLGSCTRFPTL